MLHWGGIEVKRGVKGEAVLAGVAWSFGGESSGSVRLKMGGGVREGQKQAIGTGYLFLTVVGVAYSVLCLRAKGLKGPVYDSGLPYTHGLWRARS
jgi:hypothetical protein